MNQVSANLFITRTPRLMRFQYLSSDNAVMSQHLVGLGCEAGLGASRAGQVLRARNFLINMTILSPAQYGFRKNLSTEFAI